MAVPYPKKTAADLSKEYYRQYNPTAAPKPTGMWANGQPPTPQQNDAQPYSYQSSNPPAPAFDPSKANFNQFNANIPEPSYAGKPNVPMENNKPPTPPMTNPLQSQYQTDAAAKSSLANSILGQYQANINKAPNPFTYDMNSIKQDPLYTSGLASLNQDAQTATNQSLVNLGRRGIGNSQSAVTSANAQQQNVVNQANQKLAPQVIAQKYQLYQDANTQQQQQNQNLLGLAGLYEQQANTGYNRFDNERTFDRGVLESDRTFGQNQQNIDFTQGTAAAGLTGDYNGQRTVAGQQLDLNQTNDQRNFDYGVGRDNVLDNRYNQQFDRSNFDSDRSYDLAKSGQDWGQLMQKETFDFNKAQTIWDNNFKDKGFQQSVEEAASSRGLQWANLNQRDREFVADQAFKEKSFEADQTQRGIDNNLKAAKSTTSPELAKELDGLYTGITSGQLTKAQALGEINDRKRTGLLSQADADQMTNLVNQLSSNAPTAREELTQTQIDSLGGNNPQDLNTAQLDKLWESDPSGKAAGTPRYDWASWYADPKGRVGGVPFETWKIDYGPKLR